MKMYGHLSRLLLLAPDADGGGSGAAGNHGKPPQDASAAEKVISSEVTEDDAAELVKTKRDLDEERKTRKQRETRISELEDENRRLKTPPSDDKSSKQKQSFLDGLTFFG